MAASESVISCAERFVPLMHVVVESFDGTGRPTWHFEFFTIVLAIASIAPFSCPRKTTGEREAAGRFILFLGADTLLHNVDFWSLLFL